MMSIERISKSYFSLGALRDNKSNVKVRTFEVLKLLSYLTLLLPLFLGGATIVYSIKRSLANRKITSPPNNSSKVDQLFKKTSPPEKGQETEAEEKQIGKKGSLSSINDSARETTEPSIDLKNDRKPTPEVKIQESKAQVESAREKYKESLAALQDYHNQVRELKQKEENLKKRNEELEQEREKTQVEIERMGMAQEDFNQKTLEEIYGKSEREEREGDLNFLLKCEVLANSDLTDEEQKLELQRIDQMQFDNPEEIIQRYTAMDSDRGSLFLQSLLKNSKEKNSAEDFIKNSETIPLAPILEEPSHNGLEQLPEEQAEKKLNDLPTPGNEAPRVNNKVEELNSVEKPPQEAIEPEKESLTALQDQSNQLIELQQKEENLEKRSEEREGDVNSLLKPKVLDNSDLTDEELELESQRIDRMQFHNPEEIIQRYPVMDSDQESHLKNPNEKNSAEDFIKNSETIPLAPILEEPSHNGLEQLPEEQAEKVSNDLPTTEKEAPEGYNNVKEPYSVEKPPQEAIEPEIENILKEAQIYPRILKSEGNNLSGKPLQILLKRALEAFRNEANGEPYLKIELKKSHLNDVDAVAIAAFIVQVGGIQNLDLEENNLTDEGAQALARALNTHPKQGMQIELSGNKISASGSKAFIPLYQHLSLLFLNRNSISTQGALKLVKEALYRESTSTFGIQLGDNGIEDLFIDLFIEMLNSEVEKLKPRNAQGFNLSFDFRNKSSLYRGNTFHFMSGELAEKISQITSLQLILGNLPPWPIEAYLEEEKIASQITAEEILREVGYSFRSPLEKEQAKTLINTLREKNCLSVQQQVNIIRGNIDDDDAKKKIFKKEHQKAVQKIKKAFEIKEKERKKLISKRKKQVESLEKAFKSKNQKKK